MGHDVESVTTERSDLVDVLENIKSRKSSSTSSLDSLKKGLSTTSIATLSSIDTIATLSSIDTIASLRESLADIAEGEEDAKSWMKYRMNEIDFFLNTLEVRKDAINCYMDYNNEFKSIFYNPDIEGLSLNGDSNVELDNNNYKDEKSETVLKYIERLRKQGPLESLKETLANVVEATEEDIDPSWAKFQLEELDFFLNTLNIRKDAIPYYGDYNNDFKSIFLVPNFLDGDSPMQESEDDTEEDDEGVQTKPRITKCTVCQQFIYKRNFQVEKLSKIFFQLDP
jgi:predicted RNA-binding protein with EMAP domain